MQNRKTLDGFMFSALVAGGGAENFELSKA